ncbi:uncharacterized protein [Ptychodera flava]|uniref:uncharacterized protein n=1 Tax=Ptychodera flava TaxID=63121 RepID=UPI00396A7BE4
MTSRNTAGSSLYKDYVDVLARVRQFYGRLEFDARKGTSDFRELQMILGSSSNGDGPIESTLEQVYKSFAPPHRLKLDFRYSSKEVLLKQLRDLLAYEKRDPKMEDKLKVLVDKILQLRYKDGFCISGPNALADALPTKIPGYVHDMLLNHQLDITWETESGFPSHSEIFRNPPVLAWKLRKALTIYQIFKERGQIHDHYQLENLCPPIYAKTMAWRSWYEWTFVNSGQELPELRTEIGELPHWIDKEIQDFLNAESQEECYVHGNFAVYCLVLKDDLYGKRRSAGKDSKKGQRELQLYIGSAVHGTLQRWIHDSHAHCKAVSAVLKHLRSCPGDTFIPYPGPVSTMEACLALATLLGKQAAIFIISSYGNKEGMLRREEDLIRRLNLSDMRLGMNYPADY